MLCQLLATDRSAFRVARRLGLCGLASPQPRPGGEGKVAAAHVPPPRGGPQQQRGTAPARAPNSKQRRSAKRSAKHHAGRAATVLTAAAPVAAPAAAAGVVVPAMEAAAPPTSASVVDVHMGGDRPASPSTCSTRESALLSQMRSALEDASAQLASRASRSTPGRSVQAPRYHYSREDQFSGADMSD